MTNVMQGGGYRWSSSYIVAPTVGLDWSTAVAGIVGGVQKAGTGPPLASHEDYHRSRFHNG